MVFINVKIKGTPEVSIPQSIKLEDLSENSLFALEDPREENPKVFQVVYFKNSDIKIKYILNIQTGEVFTIDSFRKLYQLRLALYGDYVNLLEQRKPLKLKYIYLDY